MYRNALFARYIHLHSVQVDGEIIRRIVLKQNFLAAGVSCENQTVIHGYTSERTHKTWCKEGE